MGHNVEVLKQQYPEFKKYINQCEPVIIEFLDKLESKNYLNKEYMKEKQVRTNLRNFGFVANASMNLANTFQHIYHNNPNIKDDFFITICNAYQVNFELLKKHLLIAVKYDEFNLDSNATLGTLLGRLHHKGLDETDFIINLLKSKDIRNSIAHCTYFYENNQIHF